MTYDVYCYKSMKGRPDVEEARSAIETDVEDVVQQNSKINSSLADALMKFDPALEKSELDYDVIAQECGITVDEAKKKYSHIELNRLDEDPSIQITICDNSVSLTIPYWYSGDEAQYAFSKIDEYAKVIHRVAGYFVYDPQTDEVLDPSKSHLTGISTYTETTAKVRQIGQEFEKKPAKKPWWKLW